MNAARSLAEGGGFVFTMYFTFPIGVPGPALP
jgi:hypothetical protein